jgi:hypothetical protein
MRIDRFRTNSKQAASAQLDLRLMRHSHDDVARLGSNNALNRDAGASMNSAAAGVRMLKLCPMRAVVSPLRRSL